MYNTSSQPKELLAHISSAGLNLCSPGHLTTPPPPLHFSRVVHCAVPLKCIIQLLNFLPWLIVSAVAIVLLCGFLWHKNWDTKIKYQWRRMLRFSGRIFKISFKFLFPLPRSARLKKIIYWREHRRFWRSRFWAVVYKNALNGSSGCSWIAKFVNSSLFQIPEKVQQSFL